MRSQTELLNTLAGLAEAGAIELEYDQDRVARFRVSEDTLEELRAQAAAAPPRPHRRSRPALQARQFLTEVSR
jgi:hypothetical protein